ncbi:MAG: dihydrofolate reductase family protein [Clostridia bacterium]|nr:dihydrofolate reductase family protein [Clostridia bacterium]
MTELFTMEFPAESIKITKLFDSKDQLDEIRENSPEKAVPPKVKEVYGDVYFPEPPKDRPYTYGCLVFSMEGKIGFPDSPQGPLIARQNFLDGEGALADFWVLNMCRAYADAAIMGAGTLQAEDDVTCHVFDNELAEQRINHLNKNSIAPVNIVVSFDGTDIPLEHILWSVEALDKWIGTSPKGAQYLAENFKKPHKVFGPYATFDDIDIENIINTIRESKDIIPIFATGTGDKPDSKVLLKILRELGIKRCIVESPSYIWHLLKNEDLDEGFFDYSGIFVGGTISMGNSNPFDSNVHPHAEILSVGIHRNNFLYTRQRFKYNVTKAE